MSRLHAKRVVITRPKEQAKPFADLLSAEGAMPICLPVIEIGPIADTDKLDETLRNLDRYDWLVLTSVNGVKAVWERFEKLGIHSFPKNLQIACIGPKTESALASRGFRADFTPDEYVAEAILLGLEDVSGKRILLPRADIARPDLPNAIRAEGGHADDITAYRTLPVQPDEEGLASLSMGVDVLTFTSPSTVENFVEIVRRAGLDPSNIAGKPLIACIGPITARAAANLGFRVDIIPVEYTIEGLIGAMILYIKDNENVQV